MATQIGDHSLPSPASLLEKFSTALRSSLALASASAEASDSVLVLAAGASVLVAEAFSSVLDASVCFARSLSAAFLYSPVYAVVFFLRSAWWSRAICFKSFFYLAALVYSAIASLCSYWTFLSSIWWMLAWAVAAWCSSSAFVWEAWACSSVAVSVATFWVRLVTSALSWAMVVFFSSLAAFQEWTAF